MSKYNKIEKSWIMYDWASSTFSMIIITTILPLYFRMVYENSGGNSSLATAFWGYSNSISTLIIAIFAPVLGTIADYKGYKKKFFKSFLFIALIFTLMLALVPSSSWKLLLICFIICSIGYSGCGIFYDSFLVDVTEEKKMNMVSAIGFSVGYAGNTISFGICMTIVLLSQANIIPLSIASAFKLCFLVTVLWWGLNSLPMIKNVKQVYGIIPEPRPITNSFKRLGGTLKNIKHHKNLFMFLLAYFFYIDGVNTIITMATSFGSDLKISSSSMLIILLMTQIVAFPCAIIFGKLSEKYNGKTMLFVGILIYSIICIYAHFVHNSIGFWILAMMVATSQGGIQAISRSYYGKLVPKEKSNEFFGFYNIFGRFAAILGPFLVGIVTQITGKSSNGLFSIIILFIVGGIILAKVPDNKEEYSVDNSVLEA